MRRSNRADLQRSLLLQNGRIMEEPHMLRAARAGCDHRVNFKLISSYQYC